MFCFRIGVAARYLLGVKKISSHIHKTGSWNLKILTEQPVLFIWDFPPPPPPKESRRESHLASCVTVIFFCLYRVSWDCSKDCLLQSLLLPLSVQFSFGL